MKRKAPSSPSFLDDTHPLRGVELMNLNLAEPCLARKRQVLESDFQHTNWPQLETEYQSFTKSITDSSSYFPNILPLITKLLDRFNSEDKRERAALGTLLKAIYNRFPQHRAFIRQSIYHIFQEFNTSSESKHNGIPDLLNFIGEVLTERNSPYLEEEFRVFLLRSLIPLYRSKWLVMFYPNLRDCISKFIIKDSDLADSVFQGMMKFWPTQGSTREFFFLDAIECFFMKVKKGLTFTSSVGKLLEKIAFCVSSTQSLVAGKALCMLAPNGRLGILIKKYFKDILPIVFPRLKETMAEHWRQGTREFAEKVSQELKKVDPVVFDDCYIASQYDSEDEEDRLVLILESSEREKNLWKKFEDARMASYGF